MQSSMALASIHLVQIQLWHMHPVHHFITHISAIKYFHLFVSTIAGTRDKTLVL